MLQKKLDQFCVSVGPRLSGHQLSGYHLWKSTQTDSYLAVYMNIFNKVVLKTNNKVVKYLFLWFWSSVTVTLLQTQNSFYFLCLYAFIHISANMCPFGLKFSQMILHTETSKLMYNWSFLFVVLHKPTLLPSTFKAQWMRPWALNCEVPGSNPLAAAVVASTRH